MSSYLFSTSIYSLLTVLTLLFGGLASAAPSDVNLVLVASGGFASCNANDYRDLNKSNFSWAMQRMRTKFENFGQGAFAVDVYSALGCFSGYPNLRDNIFYQRNFFYMGTGKGKSIRLGNLASQNFTSAAHLIRDQITDRSRRTIFVLEGHSFGGTAVILLAKALLDLEPNSETFLLSLDPIDPRYCNASRVLFARTLAAEGCKMAPWRLNKDGLGMELRERLSGWLHLYQRDFVRLHSGPAAALNSSLDPDLAHRQVHINVAANHANPHSAMGRSGVLDFYLEQFEDLVKR